MTLERWSDWLALVEVFAIVRSCVPLAMRCSASVTRASSPLIKVTPSETVGW